MSAPFDTLYLDPGTWDLLADANGNIAQAAPDYAITQDVCSACRTFLGEVYYDDTLGVPYTQQILGKNPGLTLMQGFLSAAALTVPSVATATTVVSSFDPTTRAAEGQVQFTTDDGTTLGVAL